MLIRSIVNQLIVITRVETLIRHPGRLWLSNHVLRLGGLALATACLGACEQQLANAEQPPGVSAVEKTEGPKQDNAGPGQNGRGRLVFDKAGCELPNKGGEVTSECSVVGRVSPARKGHLTYGPYLPLAAGEYAFEMEYRSAADAALAAGAWDVTARLAAEEQVIAKGEILGTANKVGVLTGRFSMPEKQGAVPVLEIRAAPSPTAETEIMRLRIYDLASSR